QHAPPPPTALTSSAVQYGQAQPTPEPRILWPPPRWGTRTRPRADSAIWPIQRVGPVLSHVSLTALLIANGDADLCIRMRRRNSLTSADPCIAACHVIGRLLDLSHISWRTCVADLLAEYTIYRWRIFALAGGAIVGTPQLTG